VEGFWPIFFLGVVLKIPVGLMLWLVWWAVRAEPAPEEAPPDADGGFGRFRRSPRRPRGPRRGPHAPSGAPLPSCPPGGRKHVRRPRTPVRAARIHARQRGTADPARSDRFADSA